MFTVRISVEDSFVYRSISTRAARPVSPRGGVYLLGYIAKEEDTIVDSISSDSSQQFLTMVSVDEEMQLMPQQELETPQEPPFKAASLEKAQYKSLDSLERRYSELAKQCGFEFTGTVTIDTLVQTNADVLVSKKVTFAIEKPEDFLKITEYLQKLIKRAPDHSLEVPPRVYSALRV